MNEELDKLLGHIDILIESWESSKGGGEFLCVAKDLQMALTKMKLIVGIERFNELPAYDRYLSETTEYISKMTKEDNK